MRTCFPIFKLHFGVYTDGQAWTAKKFAFSTKKLIPNFNFSLFVCTKIEQKFFNMKIAFRGVMLD